MVIFGVFENPDFSSKNYCDYFWQFLKKLGYFLFLHLVTLVAEQSWVCTSVAARVWSKAYFVKVNQITDAGKGWGKKEKALEEI